VMKESDLEHDALLGELQEQNHLKEQLFTICAHDLRGPIGDIRNLVILACEDPNTFGEDTLRTFLPEVRKSLDAVCGLLDNMLWWVRGQMSEIKVLRTRIDISEVFGAALAVFDSALTQKNLVVEQEYPTELTVFSDRFIVETIVRNLLSNAIKFSHPNGRISLRAETIPETLEIRLEVVDSGVGMNERRLASLFAPKISRGQAGTGGEKGSGLGLMFCADLAKRIEARLEAVSELGVGSRISMVLPDVLDGELEEDGLREGSAEAMVEL